MYLWVVLSSVVAGLFWYYLVRPLSYWKRKHVKQSPRPWLILGDDWKIFLRIQNFTEFVEWSYRLYPNERYTGIYQSNRPTLVIKDPELIKAMTVKDFDHFPNHLGFVDPKIDQLWGSNLLFLKGSEWKNMRMTLSPSFTSSKMKFLFEIINEAGQNFVKYFNSKDEDLIELEMKDTFSRFANDVIATTAFGIRVDSLREKDNEFYKMGKKVTSFDDLLTLFKFFVLLYMPNVGKIVKMKLFPPKLEKFFKGLINETIAARENKGIVRPDMINLLLEARKGIEFKVKAELDTGFATVQETDMKNVEGQPELKFTNDDIAAQALIFFFAGFDTVSTAMSLGSYELVVNPEAQQKLRDEINQTMKQCNGKLTYEALLGMKYMDMVISEILRKYPPAVVLDRECVKPYTISPVKPNEEPVSIDVGDVVVFPSWAIQNDSKYYPEPGKFIPERFSDENKHKIIPYTYMPFGLGPRNCIGSRFGLLEIKAMFFYLLSQYELVPTKKTPIPLKFDKKSFAPMAEGGFWMGLKRIQM